VVWYLGEPSPSLGCEGAVDEEHAGGHQAERQSERARAAAAAEAAEPQRACCGGEDV
jgi:hypothetical protein